MPITPLGGAGSNIDFASPIEALNALQRNPQLSRYVVGPSALTASFTASTVYAVIGNGPAPLTLVDTTTAYVFPGGTVAGFPFGLPTAYEAPGGVLTASTSGSGTSFTIIVK